MQNSLFKNIGYHNTSNAVPCVAPYACATKNALLASGGAGGVSPVFGGPSFLRYVNNVIIGTEQEGLYLISGNPVNDPVDGNVISDNIIQNTGISAIVLQGADPSGASCQQGPGGAASCGEVSSNTITGNIITVSSQSAIVVQGAGGTNLCNNNVISGNIITGAAGNGGASAIEALQCYGTIINGNSVSNGAAQAIGIAVASSFTTTTNNFLSNNTAGNIQDLGFRGASRWNNVLNSTTAFLTNTPINQPIVSQQNGYTNSSGARGSPPTQYFFQEAAVYSSTHPYTLQLAANSSTTNELFGAFVGGSTTYFETPDLS